MKVKNFGLTKSTFPRDNKEELHVITKQRKLKESAGLLMDSLDPTMIPLLLKNILT